MRIESWDEIMFQHLRIEVPEAVFAFVNESVLEHYFNGKRNLMMTATGQNNYVSN